MIQLIVTNDDEKSNFAMQAYIHLYEGAKVRALHDTFKNISINGQNDIDPAEFLKASDQMPYQDKEAGKNCFK